MRGYCGDILYAPAYGRFETLPGGCVVVDDGGMVAEVCPRPPEGLLRSGALTDYAGRLILPAFTDLHLHACQLPYRGLGYEADFDTWLHDCAYAAERRYADPDQAARVNARLVEELWENGIFHAVIMAGTSFAGTADLLRRLSRSGLLALAGKMNSDRAPAGGGGNEATSASARETRALLALSESLGGRAGYILSPEFIPACSDEMLRFLGGLAADRGLPVQSHLAESPADVATVEARYPGGGGYAAAYDRFGLFGPTPAVMAHCLFLREEERARMRARGVFAAHCPVSNLDMPSGRHLPVRRLLDEGIPVGLGSDIGGGHTLSVHENMVAAIQISRALALADPSLAPLGAADAFYLATRGGGAFFDRLSAGERVGSFEPGFSFDALVVDDAPLGSGESLSLPRRLERYVYRGGPGLIRARYRGGAPLLRPQK